MAKISELANKIEAMQGQLARLEKRRSTEAGYLPRQRRIEVIIRAALEVAREAGIEMITFENVARKCAVRTSISLIKTYFRGGRIALIDAVECAMQHGVEKAAAELHRNKAA
jgi:hypothetical protein